MPNAHVNKVVYGSETLIDLTSDTITAENVIEGYTFHGADGSTVEGTLTHLTNAEIDEITGGGGGSSITVSPLSVTSNGTYTAPSGTAYSPVTVAVPTPAPSLQSKSVTPSTSQQVVTADGSYDGLSQVTVAAMPSGTAGTPTATKGIVSNHSVTVTPSVTNTTGYITGGTKSGTAVTVSASELVSGSQTLTDNGTVNVTNLASVTVDIDFVTYHTSSSDPTSSQGSDGDIWLVTE